MIPLLNPETIQKTNREMLLSSLERVTDNASDDMEFSDEEVPEEDLGPYARTRAKKVGKRGVIWSKGGIRYGRGIGRGHKGVKRGLRKAKAPSAEFNALILKANNAFFQERNLEKAIDAVRQAIALNPEVHAAHALLASIYKEQGDLEQHASTLFLGAHANPRQPRVWRSAIAGYTEYLDNPLVSGREDVVDRIVYCYQRLINLNPKDYESMLRRAALEKQRNRPASALRQLQVLLEHLPKSTEVLQLIAEVCLDLKQPNIARELYDRCIAFNQNLDTDPIGFEFSDILTYVELVAEESDPTSAIKTLKSLSRWLLGRVLETYWDDVPIDDREWDAEDYPRRLQVSQFIPGRFPLDAYGYGLPLELRIKLGLLRFKQNETIDPQALAHFEWLEPEDTEEGAKVFEYHDLFQEVGDRLKEARLYNEALRFYRPLAETGLVLDSSFMLAIGTCSFEMEGSNKAQGYFEKALLADDNSLEARIWLARICNENGDLEKGSIYAREAITLGRQALLKPHRRRYERKEQRLERERAENELKKAYKLKFPGIVRQPLKQQRRAATLAMRPVAPTWNRGEGQSRSYGPDDVIQSVERSDLNPRSLPSGASEFREEQRKRQEVEVKNLFGMLNSFQHQMRAGDLHARNAWLDAADSLISVFRSEKVFYPGERLRFTGYDENAETISRRRQRIAMENGANDLLWPEVEDPIDIKHIPNEYCGIAFDRWLDIFLEFAFILSSMGGAMKKACYETLTHATDCSIWYHSKEALIQIYVCYASCALRLNDSDTMSNVVARWFMTRFQFTSDAYRLFDALSLLWRMPNTSRRNQMQHADFRAGPSQKFLLRQVKAIDYYLPEGYGADTESGPLPNFMRDGGNASRKEGLPKLQKGDDGQLASPQEMDIVLLVLYGHILYASGSFHNAIHYFVRAYSLDQKSPMTLLSLALAYCHANFKRQNEDRHGNILQGLAFLGEYRDARLDSVKDCSAPVRDIVRMEVDFNEARFWHMLGLSGIAAHTYKKALSKEPASQTGNPKSTEEANGERSREDFTMETAFALQTIYAVSGDTETARQITEQWLVLE